MSLDALVGGPPEPEPHTTRRKKHNDGFEYEWDGSTGYIGKALEDKPRTWDDLIREADLDPDEVKQPWSAIVEPWHRRLDELLVTRDHGKKLWGLLTRTRPKYASTIIVQDDGDRRALSVGLALCDALRLPRESTLFRVGDSEWKAGAKDPAPNAHVFNVVKGSRAMVIGNVVTDFGPARGRQALSSRSFR